MTDLPRLDDLPIPEDVRPTKGWTPEMVVMADHIGAYATLLISANLGGQIVYIPIDPDRNPLRDIIGPARATTISNVYGPAKMQIPTAKAALRRARRGGILAMVRTGEMSARDAAIILGTSRTYLTYLRNNTNETGAPIPALRKAPKRDPRQIDMFPDTSEILTE